MCSVTPAPVCLLMFFFVGERRTTEISFFIQLPYSDAPYSYEILGPVLDMAFEHVNQKYNKDGLYFTQFREVFPSLYRCDQVLSVIGQLGARYYFDYIEGKVDAVPAFFVTGCNAVMTYIGDYARGTSSCSSCSSACQLAGFFPEINALYLTSVSVDRHLDDKDRFPTLTRFTPYDPVDIVSCFVALLRQFSWRHVAVIYETSSSYYGSVGILLNEFLADDPQFISVWFSYDNATRDADPPEWTKYLRTAQKVARVFLLVAPMTDVRRILVSAKEMGMTNGDYVYVATWPFLDQSYGNLSWEYHDSDDQFQPSHRGWHDCTPRTTAVEVAFDSLLVMTSTVPDATPLFQKFLLELSTRSGIQYQYDLKNLYRMNRHVVDTYTAITEAAKAYAAAAENGLSLWDAKGLKRLIWNKNLTSKIAEGIRINENGDKKAEYVILRHEDTTSGFKKIYSFDPYSQRLQKVPNVTVTWPTAFPPPDEPSCGYDLEAPHCSFETSKTTALRGALIATSLLGLVGLTILCIWRRLRKSNHIRSLDWQISSGSLLRLVEEKSKAHLERIQTENCFIGKAAEIRSQPTNERNYVALHRQRKVWVKCVYTVTHFVPNAQERKALITRTLVAHPCIVPFVGLTIYRRKLEVVSEFQPRGSVMDLVHIRKAKLNLWLKSSLTTDVVSALTYLHSSSFKYHGKLTSANCLIDNYFTVQLTDFPFCQFPEMAAPDHSAPAKHRWSAPEVLRSVGMKFSSKPADIFSFGMVLQEVYTETLPPLRSALETSRDVLRTHASTASPWNEWNNSPDSIKNLALVCSCENPEDRLTIGQVRAYLHNSGGFRKSRNLMEDLLSRMEKYSEEMESAVVLKTEELLEEKRKCEIVLLQIFPESVVRSLTKGSIVYPESYDSATICFTGLEGFAYLASRNTPAVLVTYLNKLYSAFDDSLRKYDVYKIEAVGDSYVVASGLPARNGGRHAREVARLAMSLLDASKSFRRSYGYPAPLKQGFNTGPVATGVVGLRSPRYCIFGDTVNVASRMMTTSAVMKIQVSKTARDILRGCPEFSCRTRGLTEIKGKGFEETYWLTRKGSSVLLENDSGL